MNPLPQISPPCCHPLLTAALHRRLGAAFDPSLALEALRTAARGVRCLLILDDIWDKAHLTSLGFIDAHSYGSALVVATRIRALVPGATEVPCTVLSAAEALVLLLRAGEV